MQREHDLDFFKDKCTNCIIESYKCFFIEVDKIVEAIEIIEVVKIVEVVEDAITKNL